MFGISYVGFALILGVVLEKERDKNCSVIIYFLLYDLVSKKNEKSKQLFLGFKFSNGKRFLLRTVLPLIYGFMRFIALARMIDYTLL